MPLLRSLAFKPPAKNLGFPFTLPFVGALTTVNFAAEVTFLVGENGSGKSTFLEALACAVDSITVGSESVAHDKTLSAARALAKQFKLTWAKRTKKGFFLRAEDFFGYAKRMAQIKAEMEQDLTAIETHYAERSQTAKNLARMPYLRELGEMRRAYGEGLDNNSHGEGFFKLFNARFVGEGLYLLDEPEAALSPNRQLTLLAQIKVMVGQKAQFIIATHSPILMAYPGATLLSFDGGRIHPVEYETLEHVVVTRSFLNNPEAYLRHLLQ